MALGKYKEIATGKSKMDAYKTISRLESKGESFVYKVIKRPLGYSVYIQKRTPLMFLRRH